MERGDERRIAPEQPDAVRDIFARLTAFAGSHDMDMDLPGFRFHPLKGDLAGFWAVMVRANWRVVFRFENGHAFDVDYLNCH